MDIPQVWSAIQGIENHINIINGELNKTMTDVAWLKQSWWELLSWIRIIGSGMVVGIVLSIWNLIVVHKNGRK